MPKKTTKSTNIDISKEDFIRVLANMTPTEVNDFISSKGKKPKLIKPFIIKSK